MIWVQLALGIVAAGATVLAAWYAREAARVGRAAVDAAQATIELTKQTVDAAHETIALTEEARREDERDRRRRRLERVGELVERVSWGAEKAMIGQGSQADWWAPRNDLRHALVGLHDELPRCADVLEAREERQALAAVKLAREEVEAAVREVDAEP